MLAPFITIFQMVSISSPYSEESNGLDHERSRRNEAAASGAMALFMGSGITWLSVFLQSQSGVQIRKFQTESSHFPIPR